jgi:uncharacterized protein (TIGR00725 family)
VAGRVPYVAVVGPGESRPDEIAAAEELGRRLAEAGAVVVCGGLGGVMAAACRGAYSAGGTTIGILPGSDRADANEWVTVALVTGMGELRNGLIVRSADALVAVGGAETSFGTLSEIALARRTGVPVICLGSWEIEGVHLAKSPQDAVRRALELAR